MNWKNQGMIRRLNRAMKDQRGASLLLTLMVVLLLFFLATISVHFSNTDMLSSQKQMKQSSAYYIAEAGIERAIVEINRYLQEGRSPTELHLQEIPFHGGHYSIQIKEKSNQYGERTGFIVISTGHFEGESKMLEAYLRQPIWPEEEGIPSALQFAIYAEESIKIRTLSGLLGLGIIDFHPIRVRGDVHANQRVRLTHDGLPLIYELIKLLGLNTYPDVRDTVSSTKLSHIQVDGLGQGQKKTYPHIPMPEFDFDLARQKAKEEGRYIPHDVLSISLLGLTTTDKIIFIDGDLVLLGLDLLGLSLMDRTIVVNGKITGLVSAGGDELLGLDLIDTQLNLIAKESILFTGAVTGLQINGLLFAQGNNKRTNQPEPSLGKISVAGHLEVEGYVGGRNIDVGSGILSNLLGILTGSMKFTYHPEVFSRFPSGVGFKQNYVQLVEQREIMDDEEKKSGYSDR